MLHHKQNAILVFVGLSLRSTTTTKQRSVSVNLHSIQKTLILLVLHSVTKLVTFWTVRFVLGFHHLATRKLVCEVQLWRGTDTFFQPPNMNLFLLTRTSPRLGWDTPMWSLNPPPPSTWFWQYRYTGLLYSFPLFNLQCKTKESSKLLSWMHPGSLTSNQIWCVKIHTLSQQLYS